ncbi:MAG TPA: TetR/AcrR family transcriptional regulator [Steroidobacteraceae bacterium]|jgi:AcrR family transcriptional regulator|nr:TetR/AcrR family transcriptional regulator [Steroidobacteraceae bacterium]
MKQALRHDGAGGAGNTRTRQLAARREQLIAVAEQLFLQHGFANTSVNAIVREAGGSLATLYAEFGSKEALFESVLSERAARFFPEEQSAPRQALDAQAELRALATHMLKRMLSDDGLAVYRIAVHEAPRFPALRKALLEVGMPGLLARTARYLRGLADRGALRIGSGEAARLAASQFIALVQGQLVFSAACGGEISARTRASHVNEAVKGFLAMYRESG